MWLNYPNYVCRPSSVRRWFQHEDASWTVTNGALTSPWFASVVGGNTTSSCWRVVLNRIKGTLATASTTGEPHIKKHLSSSKDAVSSLFLPWISIRFIPWKIRHFMTNWGSDAFSYSTLLTMPPWSLALEWLHGMRPLTLPPDVFCFSSSLTSLKRDSHWRSATQVLQSI